MSDKTFVTVNDLELSLKETLGLVLLLDGFELRDTIKHYFGILEFATSRNAIPAKEDVFLLFDLGCSFEARRETRFFEGSITDDFFLLFGIMVQLLYFMTT